MRLEHCKVKQLLGKYSHRRSSKTQSINQSEPFAAFHAIDRYAKAARYFVEYPEDLRTIGVSFNTVLGASGWALQGEYSFHPDLPLQREEQSLFAEALTPIGCLLRGYRSRILAKSPSCKGRDHRQRA